MILAAAEKFSRAAEREDLAHGVFTYVMLEGLGGAADLDGDRSVSLRGDPLAHPLRCNRRENCGV